MSSTKPNRKYWSIAGRILLLLIVLAGAVQSGTPASYFDRYGFLFVLVGGIALMLISFPGAEIGRAFRHAAGASCSDAEMKGSACFWEAAGRGFWLLGGLSSVLSLIFGFIGLRTMQTASMSSLMPILIRPLLSIFYGSLLAVICLIPCWKLLGILQSRASTPVSAQREAPTSAGNRGWRFGAIFGYVLFVAALMATSRVLLSLSLIELWSVFRPALLVVVGGSFVLILFMGGGNTRLTPSSAFACMGLIGSLMGFIQMLHGMTVPSPIGIARVAGALAFILFSCCTALLGMALVGAPMEDRAIRMGQAGAPSAFSRVSWYVFPLLSLIFVVLVFNMMITPLPPAH
jgi:hypothetical protein